MNNITKELWESFDKEWFSIKNRKKRVIATMVQLTKDWDNLEYAYDFMKFTEVGFFKGKRKIPLFTNKYIQILEDAINNKNAFDTLKNIRKNNFYNAVERSDERIHFPNYAHKTGWLMIDLDTFGVIIEDEGEFVEIAKKYNIPKNTALKNYRKRYYANKMSYGDIQSYGKSIIKFIKENSIE